MKRALCKLLACIAYHTTWGKLMRLWNRICLKHKYCCSSFAAQVKMKLFYKRMDWEYKTPWCALVVSSLEITPTVNNIMKKKLEWNYMPIYKCPFCGKKVK